ncbi:MAG: hypothetical protein ACTHN5_11430 [Phycisphaerae bacterium]
MIELFGIYLFCKRLGQRLRRRGFSPIRWQLMLIFFWFLGEFVGSIIGALFAIAGGNRESYMGAAYLGALLGALAGAGMAYQIADRITKAKLATMANPAFPVEVAPASPMSEVPTANSP